MGRHEICTDVTRLSDLAVCVSFRAFGPAARPRFSLPMSSVPVSAALAAAALLLTGCAATAPAAHTGRDRAGEVWTEARGARVVGGTARRVRDSDLRASAARRQAASDGDDRRDDDAVTVVAESYEISTRAVAETSADRLIAADLLRLTMPVDGFARGRLRDTFAADRDGGVRRHNAIDLGAPTGTPVLAAAPGTVRKIHTSTKGGQTVYVLGRDGRTVFYYAHLSRYAPGLREGQRLAAGDRIGDVGATGNAQGAHLHFAIWKSPSADAFWSGAALNPYPYLRGDIAPPAPLIVASRPIDVNDERPPLRPAPPRTGTVRAEPSPATPPRVTPPSAPQAAPLPRRGGW